MRPTLHITAPIMASSALVFICGVIAAWYVHRLQANSSELLTLNVASVRAATELEIGVREIRGQVTGFLLTNDPAYLRSIPEIKVETDKWLREADRLATTLQEQEMISRLKKGYASFFAQFGAISPHESKVRLKEIIDETLNTEILPPAREYLDFNEQVIDRTSAHSAVLAERMVFGLLALGLCGAVAGLLTGFGIARSFNRSVFQLSVPISDAAGKLNEVVGPVTVSSTVSLKHLSLTMQVIAAQVGSVVQRLQQSQRELVRGEQLAAVGQLAAGVAHELRNPLTSMKILVQSALEAPGEPQVTRQDLTILEEEISRLERSIQNLLDFARPPRMEERLFDVGRLVQQTLELVASRAELQKVRVAYRASQEPMTIVGDPEQIRQVVLNLVINALDAVPPGGLVDVAVGWSGAGEWTRDLEITVADTGCGLPLELGSRIFDPFTSTKETGSGLGLSICKRIVEAHAGTIAARNHAEGGSIFVVTIPRQRQARGCRTQGESYA